MSTASSGTPAGIRYTQAVTSTAGMGVLMSSGRQIQSIVKIAASQHSTITREDRLQAGIMPMDFTRYHTSHTSYEYSLAAQKVL
ncbi:hypothetical protein SeMB42_g03584 [Synchytrium endobioticum]|uniref:Uncharacterized protein n=1 Tax=Synchytrium endobioticum TaxID=286115 RepID=A0A507D5C9_9FUNG|nr:hypothetical protein SeMB42_g03584 [Synchytrium endobioticum]